jgi:hypothetical protein
MSTVAVADSTVTKVLSGQRDVKTVWFQNFNTTVDFYLLPTQASSAPSFTTAEFKVPRASSATVPGSVVLDSASVVGWDWYAYQASGGAANLVCGQWKTAV